ncbi:hypothetical protein P175DRAFT_0521442 [Aspergillus ochraceoroseus IBT 24754]|uniref:Conidiation-specific protein n=3 Tax=Aspergillus subgen. Nidulantes TaxID=2720870 RepID=A0A0F8TXF3_9EURO|nr:uncharacterized protein P175DRAFT_0521442 [Aspergillus ochraceoroseus IBT 24754]KKK12048.1 conidiation-specific protein [Aspergillus rambellii]KKK21519.1 conidiation-specific protein [Aspergillus ochraceoroseus]PTU22256.1 hypothetical protein P175DRAFT_0521442 [Aspergillus ochraceoroseus IBT 24754]
MKYLYLVSTLCALGQATLDKPALTDNLDYLWQGNINNLNPTQSTWDQWGSGWIPADCKSIAESQGLSPSDFEVYNVHYTDCGDAWVFCRHTSSSIDLVSTIDIFGRLPVRTRSWVRHVMTIPGNDWAFNSNGNIAFSGKTAGNIDVAIHESGHSLDLLGAYGEVLSSSQTWLDNYNQDSNVPDNYARTNQVENVAQNTVVSVYDKVVPGGLGSVQPNWSKIFHQYATLEWKAGDHIIPGGTCDRHLINSETVSMTSSQKRSTRLADKPSHEFKGTYNNIVNNFTSFSTEADCKFTWA